MECVRKNLALALGFMLLMLTGFTPAALAQKGNSNSGTVVECKKALSTDGRQVELTVSGQLPAQATVNATAVQRTAPNGKQVFGAYDITIKNGSAEWQPKAGKPVMVSISDPSFTDGQLMEVYHEGTNGNEFVAIVKPTNHTITFPAKSFSVYIVTEIGEGARLEVVFHQQNGDSTSIYVKAKDTVNNDMYETVLYDPGVGTLVNTIQFRGWITSESYTVADADNGMSIAEVRNMVKPMLTNVTDGTQFHLYPLLFKIYHAGHVINQMQITERHAFGIHRNRIFPVLRGLEIEGHFAHVAHGNDGIFLAALRDVNVAVLFTEIEFAELAALVETDDGVVHHGVTAGVGLGQCNLQTAVVGVLLCRS